MVRVVDLFAIGSLLPLMKVHRVLLHLVIAEVHLRLRS